MEGVNLAIVFGIIVVVAFAVLWHRSRNKSRGGGGGGRGGGKPPTHPR